MLCFGAHVGDIGIVCPKIISVVDALLQSRQCAMSRSGNHGCRLCAQQILEQGEDCLFISPLLLCWFDVELNIRLVFGVDGEFGELPDGMLRAPQLVHRVHEVEEACTAKVERRSSTAAGCGNMPGCSEEFVSSFRQVITGSAQPVWLVHHDKSAVWEQAGHGFQVVDENRKQGFHSFHCDTVADVFQHFVGVFNAANKSFRPAFHLFGQLDFTAGGCPQAGQCSAEGALVRGVEFFNRINFVAKEFDTHRVWCGWCEDVEQVTAHSKLAAFHDEVDSLVGVDGKLLDGLSHVHFSALDE